jgi:hypothetical protein
MKIRGELWPLWATRDRQKKWKKGAQGIGNPPEIIEKNTSRGSFLMFFEVRDPSGSRRVSGPEKSAKKCFVCFRFPM